MTEENNLFKSEYLGNMSADSAKLMFSRSAYYLGERQATKLNILASTSANFGDGAKITKKLPARAAQGSNIERFIDQCAVSSLCRGSGCNFSEIRP